MSAPSCLTGGCSCGAVRFEVTEPLVSARYCHCTRCQRRTGTAASASAAIVPGLVSDPPGRGPAARVEARGRGGEVVLRRLRLGDLHP